MVKTAIENKQHLVIEGGYIPFGWEKDFSSQERGQIRFHCLVMSQGYIKRHFADIKGHTNAIEQRKDDTWCTKQTLLADNAYMQEMCETHGYDYLFIDETYPTQQELLAMVDME